MAKTPLSQKKFISIFIGSWLVWAGVHAYVLYSLGTDWKLALADSAITNFLLCGACVLLSNNLRFYLPKKDRYWYILTFSMFIAAVVWLVVKYSLRWLAPGDTIYHNMVEQSYTIRYCTTFLISAF